MVEYNSVKIKLPNGKENYMQIKKSETISFIRFFAAGIICFTAAYLSEKTLGAVAAFPFILLFSGIAYLIYQNTLHLVGFTALAAFLFKCVFANTTKEILLFSVFCAVLSFISANTVKVATDMIKTKKKNKKTLVYSVFFITALVIYILFYGTIFGNLSSKETNRNYLESTYPGEKFQIRSTYYSFDDKSYVTEFEFTDKERYRAKVSANKDGSAKIDGYRDHSRHEILTEGVKHIRSGLSTFAYEGSDFALRYNKINSDDIITKDNTYTEYAAECCFEIALYDHFRSPEEFEAMCQSYIEHLSSYENIIYESITFYGFDSLDDDEFAYMTDYSYTDKKFETNTFDDKNYSRYFSEEDTHKYWNLLV